MGLEISQRTALNQYEIINHKTNINLWLHDVVDGVIIPGRVTIENLIAGVTLGLDDLYSSSDHNHDSDYADIAHNHDSDYAALTHNHDSDYADIAHNHDSDYADIAHNHDTTYATLTEAAKHLKFSHAEWIGQTTSPTQRTINLSGDVSYSKFMVVLGWITSTQENAFISLWTSGYGKNSVGLRWGAGWTPLYFENTDTFYSDPGGTSGAFSLYSEHWNYSGMSYRAFILGV